MTAEEDLIAYVDGELDEDAARAFTERMAADPGLAARVAQHRALRDRLRAAFEPILQAPVPERLVEAARAPPAAPPARSPWVGWAAMAAGLALGVLIGRGLADHGPLRVERDGALVARGELARALDSQLAADQAGRPIQVGLSFQARGGDYCRTFRASRERIAGLACHEGKRWIAKVATVDQAPPAKADYRMAAGAISPAVLAAVDAMIAGEALDQAGETAARAKGWKASN